MSWLLNAIYAGFLILGSPWLAWRYVVHQKNRRGWLQKIFGMVEFRTSSEPCIWFHAVSVGEVNLLAPILEQLKRKHPEWEMVISTTTETGFDLAQKKYADHYVFFCPFDFTWAVKRVLRRLRPRALVLAELELWPNLIRTTSEAAIPVAVVNGRLSESSYNGYQKFHWLIAPILKRLSSVSVQNQTYADRFIDLGCKPEVIRVTGNVKFDGVVTDRNNPDTLSLASLAGLSPQDFVWVAGSTQLEEDLMAAQVYQRLSQRIPNLRLILVPRHPERCNELVKRLELLGIPSRFRSRLDHDQPSKNTGGNGDLDDRLAPVLIVDVIGELGGWWGCADVAYVGGSMGRRGGQNMIEPAAFGVPVSFGPHTENFRDIVDEFLRFESATIIRDSESMEAFVFKVLSQSDWARQIGARAQNVVMNHVGASQRTVDSLCLLVEDSSDDRQDPLAIHAA